MNFRWKDNPSLRHVLLGGLVIAGLFLCYEALALLQGFGSGMDLFARANSTRTAIALTSNALLGPFPTSTGPTPTPSRTPTITPTPSLTPTATPTQTPFRYFIETATPRTLVPGFGQTSIVPTGTFLPPTNPPRQPTNPPPQATNPPQPTKQPRPTKSHPTKIPKPTKTPKK